MSEYIPVYTRIWSDKRFRDLSKEAKLVFFYIGWNSSVNLIGIYELDIETAKIQTGLFIDFDKAFKEVLEKCSVKYETETGLIFLKNKFKYQPKNSPKVVAGAIKELSLLPTDHIFKKEFIAEYKEFLFKASPDDGRDINVQISNLKKVYSNDTFSIKRILMTQGFSEAQIVKNLK